MEVEAARFTRALQVRNEGATVVALSGELGAGKTAFVKGIAKELGIGDHITSPTFVIMKIYDVDLIGASSTNTFKRLIHIDAYRLKGEHHLAILGWRELLRDPHTLICIEWPEQCPGAIPEDAIRVTLRYSGEHERDITYSEARSETSRTT